jgi:hypothetical protein
LLAGIMAAVFLTSPTQILRQAFREYAAGGRGARSMETVRPQ